MSLVVGTKRTYRECLTTSARDGTTDVPSRWGHFRSLTEGGRFGSLHRGDRADATAGGAALKLLSGLQGGAQPPVRKVGPSSSQPADLDLAISPRRRPQAVM
jgi:hypothetical protein